MKRIKCQRLYKCEGKFFFIHLTFIAIIFTIKFNIIFFLYRVHDFAIDQRIWILAWHTIQRYVYLLLSFLILFARKSCATIQSSLQFSSTLLLILPSFSQIYFSRSPSVSQNTVLVFFNGTVYNWKKLL